MNNFKKAGLTALAGSLVAFSAQAGELTVTVNSPAWADTATNEPASAVSPTFLKLFIKYSFLFVFIWTEVFYQKTPKTVDF